MGRTYRGVRKKFGSKKTQEHKTRSKWNAKNGTRLRSLNADIVDFQEVAGVEAEALHRPPSFSEKKISKVLGAIAELRVEKPPVLPSPVPKQNSFQQQRLHNLQKKKVRDFLNSLSTKVLSAKKAYAAQQVSHLQRSIQTLEKEYLPADPSFAPAIKRLTLRKKHWDTQSGVIGPILASRGAYSREA